MEVRSSGSRKDNSNRILVAPLLEILRNRDIEGEAKTGKEWMGISWFKPGFMSFHVCLGEAGQIGWSNRI
jgi:hypothetical protein